MTPARDRFGRARITVKVSDGAAEATDTFVLTVRDKTAPTVTEVSPPNGAKKVPATTESIGLLWPGAIRAHLATGVSEEDPAKNVAATNSGKRAGRVIQSVRRVVEPSGE